DGSLARFLAALAASAPDASPARKQTAEDDEAAEAHEVDDTKAGVAGSDVTVEMARALRRAAAARGVAPILDAAAELGNKDAKEQLPVALALLARAYRDALVIAAGAPE